MCLNKSITKEQYDYLIHRTYGISPRINKNVSSRKYKYILDNIFQIAKKDIIVYKRVYPDLTSNIQLFQYELGMHYYQTDEEFGFRVKHLGLKVYKGLHAFTKKPIIPYWSDNIILKCIIPKGSLYLIQDNDKEIVSNNLIVDKIIIYLY